MKLLEKLNEMFPKQWQDKVMTAYVGRALSLDIPQLYRNIKYGMRNDPIIARQEYWKAIENWDEVMEEDRIHTQRIAREQIPVAPEQSEIEANIHLYSLPFDPADIPDHYNMINISLPHSSGGLGDKKYIGRAWPPMIGIGIHTLLGDTEEPLKPLDIGGEEGGPGGK
jgi:hypothetical protein